MRKSRSILRRKIPQFILTEISAKTRPQGKIPEERQLSEYITRHAIVLRILVKEVECNLRIKQIRRTGLVISGISIRSIRVVNRCNGRSCVKLMKNSTWQIHRVVHRPRDGITDFKKIEGLNFVLQPGGYTFERIALDRTFLIEIAKRKIER